MDLSESFEEAFIVYCMVCTDLVTLRHFVSQAWGKLAHEKDCQTDPVVLVVVSNIAMALGREILHEASPIFKEYGGPAAMADRYLDLTTSICPDATNNVVAIMQNATDLNATYKAIFNNYAWVWFMIQSLADDHRWDQYITGYIAECPADDDCDVDYGTSWDSMSLREKSNHDIAILKDLWYEARIIQHHVPGYKATDEFIRGVQDYTIAGSDIPFSLVFAAQVTLDTNHTVRKYAEVLGDKFLEQIISINNSLQ